MRKGKETLKRWIVSLLSVAMVVGSVPMPTYAETMLLDDQEEIVSELQDDTSAVYLAEDDEFSKEILSEEENVSEKVDDMLLDDTEEDKVLLEDLVGEEEVKEEVKEEDDAVEAEEKLEPVGSGADEVAYLSENGLWISVSFDEICKPGVLSDNAQVRFEKDFTNPVVGKDYFKINIGDTGISANHITIDLNGHTVAFSKFEIAEGYTVDIVASQKSDKIMFGGTSADFCNHGTFTLSKNTALGGWCTRVNIDNYGTFNMVDSKIFNVDNSTSDGTVIENHGTFNMLGSACIEIKKDNRKSKDNYIENFGTFSMSDNAVINGIHSDKSVVSNNSAGTFTMAGKASIKGASAAIDVVDNKGDFSMDESATIEGCKAADVVNNKGDFSMVESATIEDCEAADVVDNKGDFSMVKSAAIKGCKAADDVIDNDDKANFVMKGNAIIIGCTSEDGRIVENDAIFNMCDDSFIVNNHYDAEDANKYIVSNNGLFTMNNDASISSNKYNAFDACGGTLEVSNRANICGQGAIGVSANSAAVKLDGKAEVKGFGVGIDVYQGSDVEFGGEATVSANGSGGNSCNLRLNEVSVKFDDDFTGKVGVTTEPPVASGNKVYFTNDGDSKNYKDMAKKGYVYSDAKDMTVECAPNGNLYVSKYFRPVVLLNNEEYATLSEAIAFASTHKDPIAKGSKADEIKLIADFNEENVVIGEVSANKNILIDLNGHMLGTSIVVNKDSALEVSDSGKNDVSKFKLKTVSNNMNGFVIPVMKIDNFEGEPIKGGFLTGVVDEEGNSKKPVITNEGTVILADGQLLGFRSKNISAVCNEGNLKVTDDFAFKYDYSTESAGAIANLGKLDVGGKAVFENCFGKTGGAIGNGVESHKGNEDNGIELNVEADASFTNCKAYAGGAIFAANVGEQNGEVYDFDKLTVAGSVSFNECEAFYGGAIYAGTQDGLGRQTRKPAIVDIKDNVKFNECKAILTEKLSDEIPCGGAIYVNGANLTIDGKDVVFDKCSAAYAGGAIYATSGKVNIGKTSFDGCYAENNFSAAQGGAVAGVSTSLSMNGAKFTDCYVDSKYNAFGGAVYAEGKEQKVVKPGPDVVLSIEDTTFDNCNVSSNYIGAGGAVCTKGNVPVNVLGNSEFNNCSSIVTASCNAIAVGGAVAALNAMKDGLVKATVADATKFTNCKAETVYSESVSVDLVEAASKYRDDEVFTPNYVGAAGGALFTGRYELAIKDKVSFAECIAKNTMNGKESGAFGGAIAGDFGSLLKVEGKDADNKVTISNCKAESLLKSAAGGAIYLYNKDTKNVDLLNTKYLEISNCSATSSGEEVLICGGAICLKASSNLSSNIVETSIKDSKIENNDGYSCGGAIYSYNVDMNLDAVSIDNCYAKNKTVSVDRLYGGAICSNKKHVLSGSSKISGAKLIVESAEKPVNMYGVAVYATSFDMKDDAQINGCSAELLNGKAGVQSNIYGTVYTQNATITRIVGNASISNNILTNETVSGNIYGAGLCTYNKELLISENAVIMGNEANVTTGRVYGAGVYSLNDKASVSVGGLATIYGNVVSDNLLSMNGFEKQQNNFGMRLMEGGKVVSINLAADYKGKLGVSLFAPVNIVEPKYKLFFTENSTPNLVNKNVFSDYENFELNYDKSSKKMYLSKHEDKWELEVVDGVLKGYCKEPKCKYYDKDKKCSFIVAKAEAEDDRYNVASANYVYKKAVLTTLADGTYKLLSGNDISTITPEFEGVGSTSMNRTSEAPTNPGTYRVYYKLYFEDYEEPFELYDDFTITRFARVKFIVGDDGKIKGISDNKIVKEVNEGDKVARPYPNPVYVGDDSGKEFVQWTLVRKGGVKLEKPEKYDFTQPVSKNMVIVATYDYDHGDITDDDLTGRFGDNANLSDEKVATDIWVAGLPRDAKKQTFSVPYKGSKWTFDSMRVYDGTKLLTKGKDYTVSYKNNLNAHDDDRYDKNSPQIIIKGKGDYKLNHVIYFTISKVSVGDPELCQYLSDLGLYSYTGKSIKPVPTVYNLVNGSALKNKKDFEVTYERLNESTTTWVSELTPKFAGKYHAVINGINNYEGTVYSDFEITGVGQITKAKVTGLKKTVLWVNYGKDYLEDHNYESIVQTGLQVKVNGVILEEGTDYVLNYSFSPEYPVAAGSKADVIIKGIGDYSGVKRLTYKVAGLSVKKGKANWKEGAEFIYNGEAYNPQEMFEDETVKLFVDGHVVAGKADDIDYVNVTKKASFNVYGDPYLGFTGSKKLSFKINPRDINDDDVVIDVAETAPFSKAGAKPNVYLGYGDKDLVEGVDYTVTCKSNKKLGEGTVIIKGKGNFTGKVEKTFKIEKAKLIEECNYDPTMFIDEYELFDNEETVVSILPNVAYSSKKNGYKSTPSLFEVYSGKALKLGKDYTIRYFDEAGNELTDPKAQLSIGTSVDVVIKGIGNYEGIAEGSYKIVQYSLKSAKAKFGTIEYTGSAVKPLPKSLYYPEFNMDVTCKVDKQKVTLYGDYLNDSGYSIVDDIDYHIVSVTNNVKRGTAKVTVIGDNIYGGMKTFKFKISQRIVPAHVNHYERYLQ